MKITKITFLLSLAFVASFNSLTYGQGANGSNLEAKEYLYPNPVLIKTVAEEYAGTPYQNETFNSGIVISNNKPVMTSVPLRYNVHRDEIEIRTGATVDKGNVYAVLRSPDISVKILNETFVYLPETSIENLFGYFSVVNEGENLSLYKKLKKNYIEGKLAMNTLTRDIPPTFKDVEEYYLVTKDGTFSEVSGSRNKILELFPDKNAVLKTYVKQSDLNIKKEDDLEKLVIYYNSL